MKRLTIAGRHSFLFDRKELTDYLMQAGFIVGIILLAEFFMLATTDDFTAGLSPSDALITKSLVFSAILIQFIVMFITIAAWMPVRYEEISQEEKTAVQNRRRYRRFI